MHTAVESGNLPVLQLFLEQSEKNQQLLPLLKNRDDKVSHLIMHP